MSVRGEEGLLGCLACLAPWLVVADRINNSGSKDGNGPGQAQREASTAPEVYTKRVLAVWGANQARVAGGGAGRAAQRWTLS